MRPLVKITVLAALLLTLEGVSIDAQSPAYTRIDLGRLGGSGSCAYAINNAGQMVGYSDVVSAGAVIQHAALWAVGGDGAVTCTDLGSLVNDFSGARGINGAGQIVGYSYAADGKQHAALFTLQGAASVVTDLGTYGGSGSIACGIDDAGHVVGYSSISQGTYSNTYAVLYTSNGAPSTPSDLGAAGVTVAQARAIGPAGLAVGQYPFSEPSRVASRATSFGLTGGTAARTDLGGFGDNNSYAGAVSSDGRIAGYAFLDGGITQHAVIFGAPGSGAALTDLGVLPTATSSDAWGINSSGQVVGVSNSNNGGLDGFLYTPAAGMQNLLTLLAPQPDGTHLLVSALGNPINDWGQIVVSDGSSTPHAILLNPVAPLTVTSNVSQESRLVAGGNYAKIPVLVDSSAGGHSTVVSLPGGTASANRDVTVGFLANPVAIPLASDAFNVAGTAADIVVVQASYDGTLAASLFGTAANARLGWFDGAKWVNAVDGDTAGTGLFVGNRAYNAATDLHPGSCGIDTVNQVAWAVINHGGTFGVILDPDVLRKIASTGRSSTVTILTLASFTGHTYQLQRSASLFGASAGFSDVESPQTGRTGTTLTFSHDDGQATQGFYRIQLDP